MRIRKLFLSAVVLLSITACGSLPPINFSVPNVGISQKKIEAEVKSLTVGVARPDEKTGELPFWVEKDIPILWQTAMTEAINKMTVFQDDAQKKVNISVKILKLDMPGAGISFTTHAEARYEITDRRNGDIIYTQNISSSGTVPFEFSALGAARARESVNRSVQNNITQFLQALETIDITKPQFPAKPAGAK